MLIALLGGPNTGKTRLAGRYSKCLYMPVHFVMIAAHRHDARKIAAAYLAGALRAKRFTISGGDVPHAGPRALVRDYCDNETRREEAEPDMEVAATLFRAICEVWGATGRDIIAEGEILNKRRWLDALDPDKVVMMINPPKAGLVTTQRRGKTHPAGKWDADRYRQHQANILRGLADWMGSYED